MLVSLTVSLKAKLLLFPPCVAAGRSHLKQTPSLVVDCWVDFAHGLKLVCSFEHIGNIHTSSAGNVLHVKTLVDLRSGLHALEDLSGVSRDTSRKSATCSRVTTISRALSLLALLLCSERAACEEEVDVCSFQHMVVDFVEIGQGTDLLGDNVTLAESLQLAPDTSVCIFNQTALASVVFFILSSLHVDPDLDLNGASAIIQLVGDICGLLADVADLTNKRDCGQFGAIDGEVFTVGLIGFEKLLDSDGA